MIATDDRYLVSAHRVILGSLALLTSWFVVSRVILAFVDDRIAFQESVLAGTMEPPYQYRVLKHILAQGIEAVLGLVVHSPRHLHRAAYGSITLATFVVLFGLLDALLRRWFSNLAALLGCALFAGAVPLATTGSIVEGDFIALVFVLGAFGLMLRNRAALASLPVLVFVAALNREQAVVIVALYALFAYVRGEGSSPRTWFIAAASAAAWAAAYFGIRLWFGFKVSQYTMSLHVAHNTDAAALIYAIVPLWVALVGGLVVLAVQAFSRCPLFFRVALMALIPYTAFFFVNGNMWEMAKWLSALFVLIPVALQRVTGEWIPEDLGVKHQPR